MVLGPHSLGIRLRPRFLLQALIFRTTQLAKLSLPGSVAYMLHCRHRLQEEEVSQEMSLASTLARPTQLTVVASMLRERRTLAMWHRAKEVRTMALPRAKLRRTMLHMDTRGTRPTAKATLLCCRLAMWHPTTGLATLLRPAMGSTTMAPPALDRPMRRAMAREAMVRPVAVMHPAVLRRRVVRTRLSCMVRMRLLRV